MAIKEIIRQLHSKDNGLNEAKKYGSEVIDGLLEDIEKFNKKIKNCKNYS